MEENEKGFINIPRGFGNRLKKMETISRAEWRVLIHVFDKTTSYGKMEDRISAGQISKETGLSLKWVKLTLSNLEAKKIIAIRRELGRGHQNEIHTIRLENPDGWVGEEISRRYRKQLKRRKNSYRKSRQKGSEEKQASLKSDGGRVGNPQEVGEEISKGGGGNPHIAEQRIYKEINKEVMSEPKKTGSDDRVFLNPSSKEKDKTIDEDSEELEGWTLDKRTDPLFIEKQKEERLERQTKLSPKKKERWTDGELKNIYGHDVDCQQIRERFEATSSEEELRNLQIHFLRNLNKIPRERA
jgi:hypothetical protein